MSDTLQAKKFPAGVAEHLNWYVYRLIDPRNGETFYVGKGCGDRIFQHVTRALPTNKDEDAHSLKFQRIKSIDSAGLHVGLIIHRHNIKSEDIAFQIEAALIDAYPGLTNEVRGHGSNDYGMRHVIEIIAEYDARPFEAKEALILINISKSYEEEDRGIYDAVRGMWRIDINKAKKFNLVLAHRRGLVIGVFRPTAWLPATKNNFSWLNMDIQGRAGFEGKEAEESTKNLYLNKRVPDEYRMKGAANPIRFIEPLPPMQQAI